MTEYLIKLLEDRQREVKKEMNNANPNSIECMELYEELNTCKNIIDKLNTQ